VLDQQRAQRLGYARQRCFDNGHNIEGTELILKAARQGGATPPERDSGSVRACVFADEHDWDTADADLGVGSAMM
jgi:hypothetical protein